MTDAQAQKLVDKIDALVESENRQIAHEFEGRHPGFDLPQTYHRDEVIAQINASGTHAYAHGWRLLVSRPEFDAARSTFNGRVRDFQATNPGQTVPVERFREWESEAGMTVTQLKHFAKTFDA